MSTAKARVKECSRESSGCVAAPANKQRSPWPRSFQYLSFVPSGLYPYYAGFSIRAGPPREKSLSAHTLAQDSQQPVSPREKSLSAHTLAQKAVAPATIAMPLSDDAGIMTLESGNEIGAIAAYSTWTKSPKYDWYEEYTDDKISSVDKNKNITVDPTQINISQEENSQFIPFEMSRYYDGYDLMEADIWFYYLSSDGIVGS